MVEQPGEVVLGVDTHLEFHVAVVVDFLGRVLDTITIDTSLAGYRRLLGWAHRHGALRRAGVEGVGRGCAARREVSTVAALR